MEADLEASLDRPDVVIGRLDADPRHAEHGDGEIVDAWSAPRGLRAMPERLAPRAQQLLAQLNGRIQRLEAERTTVGDHLAVLRTLPAAAVGSRAVYLDVTG